MNVITEEMATVSFMEYFINYYNQNQSFHMCTLNEALARTCFSPAVERKILLLYFHNATNKFSQMFCNSLVQGEIKDLIDEHYFLLAWDVTNVDYHNVLISSASTVDSLLGDYISKKRAALFVIFPSENTAVVATCIYIAKEENVLSSLYECIKLHEDVCKTELQLANIKSEHCTENDFTSTKFQQLMFNQLGDRDYDRFEKKEHEFLKDKIGFSLYGPPEIVEGYDKNQKANIEKIYKKILSCSNTISKWKNVVVISFIYNCTEPLPAEKIEKSKKDEYYNPNIDFVQVPLYVLRKCKGSDDPCRIIIDSNMRVYKSWEDYITNNELPKCLMILPKNGRYCGNSDGNVLLERHLSPACGVSKLLLKGLDITSTTVGLLSGGVFAAALIPTITVAPIALTAAAVAGVGVGIYSIARSSATLVDRFQHKQDMDFTSSEARGAYINIVAGSLGFVGAGANLVVTQLVSRGVAIGQGARITVNVINMANIGAGGMGIINSGYDIFDQWINNNRAPSLLTVVQLSSSILFFGNAVYNFKMAGSMIDETQTNTLRDMQDSLRSNRHRKTFNKLMKETLKQSSDVRTGRAEVISSIRKLNNKDEVFAILTRSNKLFNENNVKFAAQNGKITLNGIAVDMEQFGSMSKDKSLAFLIDLPPNVAPTPENIESMTIKIENIFNVNTLETMMAFNQKLVVNGYNFASMATSLIGMLTECIQKKVIRIVDALMHKLIDDGFNFPSVFKTIFPNTEKLTVLLKVVINFLKIKMNEYEQDYQNRKIEAQKSEDFDERKFNAEYRINPETAKRAVQYFEMGVDFYMYGVNPTEQCLKELTNYFRDWLSVQILRFEEKKEKNRIQNRLNKKQCKICNGCYYSN